jgi:hypothetical protein
MANMVRAGLATVHCNRAVEIHAGMDHGGGTAGADMMATATPRRSMRPRRRSGPSMRHGRPGSADPVARAAGYGRMRLLWGDPPRNTLLSPASWTNLGAGLFLGVASKA